MGQSVYQIEGLKRLKPRLAHAMSGAADGSMSFRYVSAPREAMENRQRFLETLQRLPGGYPLFMMGNGVAMRGAFDPPLKPGEEIRVVGRGEMHSGMWQAESEIRAEALVTTAPGIFFFLTIADCYPVALYDPAQGVLALAHISRATSIYREQDGERVSPLLGRLVDFLQEKFGTEPGNLVAAIGPGISRASYLRQDFAGGEGEPEWEPYLTRMPEGVCIDLMGFTRWVLGQKKLHAENIFAANLDTVTAMLPDGSRQFFSHRGSTKTGEPEGRGAFVAGMPIEL